MVKKAKLNFFRKKLDEASNAKEAFEISKWHKSRGNFCTPPLVDPLHPENEPAQTPEGKRDIILRNLLSDQIDVEDVSRDIPTVATSALPFPQIFDSELPGVTAE